MCVEDIAIARRTYSQRTQLVAGVTTEFKANPARLSITICGQGNVAGGVLIAQTADDANNLSGLVQVRTNPGAGEAFYGITYATIDYRTHGAIVWEQLFCRGDAGRCVVTEVLMQEDLANELRLYLLKVREQYARK